MAEDKDNHDVDQEGREDVAPGNGVQNLEGTPSNEGTHTPEEPDGVSEPPITQPEETPPPKKPTFWQGLREVLIILVIAAIVAIFIQSFFMKAFMIPSSSMSPTLQIGDRVLVDRVTYYFRKPRRGDIIVFRYPPKDPKALNTTNLFFWPIDQILETLHVTHRMESPPFVKRVIATGGETIEIKQGQIYINGKKIKEDYKVPDNYDMPATRIPDGELFCMGDNRPNSRDSRYWGTVPIRAVIGKVFLKWWPPKDFGIPKH
jgi:signal peptidase I